MRPIHCLFLILYVLLLTVAPLRAAEPPAKPAAPAEPKKADVDWAGLFKMHWENRVKGFKEQNLAIGNVVLLGDSITEGFEVPKYFPGRRVLNRGIGADVIGNALPPDDPRGVLRRLDNSVFDCAATEVFILIGINDLNSGRNVETMEAGYREMLTSIRKRMPELRLYVQSVLPTRGNFANRNVAVLQFNTKLRTLATEFNCTYIDLHTLMTDAEGKLKAEYTNDGLHLTDPAYLVWREQILAALKWK